MATEIASPQGLEMLPNIAPARQTSAEALPVITQLVPVIWELISRYITGADVISVCSTLSKPMWLRFRLGISGDFIIRPTEPIPPSPAMFSFLQYLPRLTSITLYNNNLRLWRSGPRVFDLFPSTIRSISLNIPFRFGTWLVIPRDRPLMDRKEPAVHSHKSRRAKVRHILLEIAPTFDLGQKFPVLESLTIRAANNDSQLHYRLEDLRIYDSAIQKAKKNFLSGLPSSLQRIALPALHEYSEVYMSVLPDGLLDIEFFADGQSNDPKFKLPSKLRRLAIEVHMGSGSADFSSKVLANLPRTVEMLEWFQKSTELDSSKFRHLASHPLHTLIFHHGTFTDPTLSLFALMPRALTALEINGPEPSVGSFSELPRSLISFVWTVTPVYPQYNDRLLRYYDFENLPRDLEVLELRDMFVVTDLDYKLLPRNLTRLVLSISPCFWPGHECFTMECRNICRKLPFCREAPRNGVPSELIGLDLPPKLLSLRLINTYFGRTFFQSLPFTLETLDFDSQAPLDETTLSLLPSNLKVLNIERAPLLSPTAFNFLPTSELTELKVWNGNLHGESFALLPRGLTRLHVDAQRFYSDSHIKDLPRGLLHFIVPLSDKLTSKCAADLPRSLLTFRISKIILDDSRPSKMDLVLAFPSAVPVFDLNFVNHKGRRVHLENLS